MHLPASLAILAPVLIAAQAPATIDPTQTIERAIAPGQTYEASLRLRRGESADVVVLQQGIDLVIDLLGPDGRLRDSVDSPNGRDGDEPVTILADRAGAYTIRIRTLDLGAPAGRFRLRVAALRDQAETARVAAARRAVRQEASGWLRTRSAALPADAPFDALVAEARVVGLGEATHGSRELNDIRLVWVKRLVERHGFRVIALEDSASRWRDLAGYVSGAATAPPAGVSVQWGWIGRRTRHELLVWARQWNLAHPADRVRLVGVDPQGSAAARARLDAFLARAYGADFAAAWAPAAAELAAADEQTAVFGNSDVTSATRDRLLDAYSRLEADSALLALRFGADDVADARATARELVQFAEFNGSAPLARSRDWYMAANLIAALGDGGAKAVYWGHNAHVSAAGRRTAGAVLRQALGCSYVAVATTFGQGAFVAQRPNDPEDRLIVSTLPAAAEESIESVLAGTGPGARFVGWRCGGGNSAPAWLGEAQPLHWIGGLYAPDTVARGTYQPYLLIQAFDGIAYFPRVAAEEIPGDQPRIPPRPRAR